MVVLLRFVWQNLCTCFPTLFQCQWPCYRCADWLELTIPILFQAGDLGFLGFPCSLWTILNLSWGWKFLPTWKTSCSLDLLFSSQAQIGHIPVAAVLGSTSRPFGLESYISCEMDFTFTTLMLLKWGYDDILPSQQLYITPIDDYIVWNNQYNRMSFFRLRELHTTSFSLDSLWPRVWSLLLWWFIFLEKWWTFVSKM